MCEVIDFPSVVRRCGVSAPRAAAWAGLRPEDLIDAARRHAAETDEVIRVIETGDLGACVALRDALQARL